MAGITIETKLRPCLVGKAQHRCLFHGFWQEHKIYGRDRNQETRLIALVETDKGHIMKADPMDIQFIDRKIEEYSFGEEKENDQT